VASTIDDNLAKIKQALKPAPKNVAVPMPGVPAPRYHSKYAEALEEVKKKGLEEIGAGVPDADRCAFKITKSSGHGRGPVVWMRKRWPLYRFWERKVNEPGAPSEDRDIYVMYVGVEQPPRPKVKKKRKGKRAKR
jgi:hypothetical protein